MGNQPTRAGVQNYFHDEKLHDHDEKLHDVWIRFYVWLSEAGILTENPESNAMRDIDEPNLPHTIYLDLLDVYTRDKQNKSYSMFYETV